jgi:Ca2+-binding RTX toxin-like protein
MSDLKELDISYLDTLLGTYESDLDGKLMKSLSDDSFTYAMYKAGYLTATTDGSGTITGWEFNPPQNFDMFMTGTSGADILSAGNGDDIIVSGDGNDTVDGGAGNDMLYGGAGNDMLYGGAGNDIINGGAGTNTLSGGEGADVFSFSAIDAFTGVDTITDFNIADGDKIDISDILEGYDPVSSAISDFVQIFDGGQDTFITVDANGGADNYQFMVIVQGTTGITSDQLILESAVPEA